MSEEPDTLARQSIDIRSFYFLLAVAAEFAPPEIVCEDKNNIGSGALGLGSGDCCLQEGQRAESNKLLKKGILHESLLVGGMRRERRDERS